MSAKATKKGKKMSREEALQLYQELQNSMNTLLSKNAPPKAGKVPDRGDLAALARREPPAEFRTRTKTTGGARAAVSFMVLCCLIKVGVSTIDFLKLGEAAPAEAVVMTVPKTAPQMVLPQPGQVPQVEMKTLTSLDQRRVELEERARRLDERESDISKRDKEYAVRVTELRELTDKLKIDRDKNEKKKSVQLDQLANVYGAMNPQEAAQLIEQLDVTIALPLLQRLPEKRMGQILPLMSPERALAMTKMLSSGKAE